MQSTAERRRRRSHGAASTLALAAVFAVSCGGSRTAERPGTSDVAGDAPPTDRDPPPFTPEPDDGPHTGGAVGVATSGGYDQARGVAIRFVQALRDGDEAVLMRLLAERLASAQRLAQTPRRRVDIINAILRSPRRSGLGPDLPLNQIFDPSRMEVRPLAAREGEQALPSGLSGGDLRVTFPLVGLGRRILRHLTGWAGDGTLIIRPGVEPQIVAL